MTKKVAMITAGGSGMGAGAARRLAQDGFEVAILSSSGKGEALATELGGIGVTGSNQSNDDLKRLVDAAMAKWGRIDVLVNSGGHGPHGHTDEISATIAFLASDGAGYITGQNLRVDGGITRSV